MTHKPVHPPGAPPPLAPYSPATVAGNVVYTSGVLPMDRAGATIGIGDVAAQTRAILNSIRSIIETAGGSLTDVAFNSIFLKRLSDYAAMNEVYKEYFPNNPPARYCVRADLVREEFLVEIASIAHLPQKP